MSLIDILLFIVVIYILFSLLGGPGVPGRIGPAVYGGPLQAILWLIVVIVVIWLLLGLIGGRGHVITLGSNDIGNQLTYYKNSLMS